MTDPVTPEGGRGPERDDFTEPDVVDLAGEASFPASDPPGWWSGHDAEVPDAARTGR